MTPVGNPLAPAKPADAPKPADAATTNEKTDQTDAPAEGAKKETKKAEPREYTITKHSNGSVEDAHKMIDELAQNGSVEVFVVIGREKHLQSTLALKKFGRDNDLNGSYSLFATRNLYTSPEVSTEAETKRVVKGL